MNRIRRSMVALVALTLVASSCGVGDDDGHPSTTTASNPLVVLPALDRDHVRAADNPTFGSIVDVADLFETLGGDAIGRRLTRLVSTIDSLERALGCAYREERVGVRVYQDRVFEGSLGLAVALRGGALEAVLDVAGCVIVEQLEGLFDFPMSDGPDDGPHYGLCVDIDEIDRNGETYTVILAGSSDWMCTELRGGRAPRSVVAATTTSTATITTTTTPTTTTTAAGPSIETLPCTSSGDLGCPSTRPVPIPPDLTWDTTTIP